MNKFIQSLKVTAAMTCLIILTVAATLWMVREVKVFSPPESGTVSSMVPGSLDFSSPSSEAKFCYVRELGFYRITAYCPCEICCGKWADGYTSSGKPAVGLIVAARPGIPFGTVLDIPGYGVASVQDRGGAITGNNLDVLFATHAEAKEWGVQYLMVKEIR